MQEQRQGRAGVVLTHSASRDRLPLRVWQFPRRPRMLWEARRCFAPRQGRCICRREGRKMRTATQHRCVDDAPLSSQPLARVAECPSASANGGENNRFIVTKSGGCSLKLRAVRDSGHDHRIVATQSFAHTGEFTRGDGSERDLFVVAQGAVPVQVWVLTDCHECDLAVCLETTGCHIVTAAQPHSLQCEFAVAAQLGGCKFVRSTMVGLYHPQHKARIPPPAERTFGQCHVRIREQRLHQPTFAAVQELPPILHGAAGFVGSR
jgi:hypothetical protein